MDSKTSYQQTLDYLYSFVDYSLTRGLVISPEDFNLDRMREFMEYLGMPHLAYPVIHIAGTKGKGSVSAMCASALQVEGHQVGLYISPHLHDYTERIQFNGQPIAKANLVALVDEIRPYLDKGTQLTTFEITTALALLHFARMGATAVVAEVGLGGRLDATNIVKSSVSVITSISFDHVSVLGETLAEIAAEKAGIIKPGVPVVLAPQKDEARHVVEEIAEERHVPLIQVGRDYVFAPISHSLEGQSLYVWSDTENLSQTNPQSLDGPTNGSNRQEWAPIRLEIPLLGRHQVENAATAYATMQAAREHGLPISETAIRDGFARTTWPGRFEVLGLTPPVVVDSAHNRDSALRLRQALDDYFGGRPVVLVFGASEDKDVASMLTELMPRVQQVIATRSFHPRAMEPDQVAEFARPFGRPVIIIPSVNNALQKAISLAGDDGMVLATGSLFIAASARDTWYNHL